LGLCYLAHDHGTEQLSAQPGSTSWSNSSFNNGDLEIWAFSTEHIGSGESTRPSTNNDNVGFGEFVKVLEVAACHGTRDLTLSNWCKGEVVPLTMQLSNRLRLAIDWHISALHGLNGFDTKVIGVHDRVLDQCCGWCHVGRFRPATIRVHSI